MDLEYPDFHDLNFSNRPVRTRMPGGVAGAQSMMAARMPIDYSDWVYASGLAEGK